MKPGPEGNMEEMGFHKLDLVVRTKPELYDQYFNCVQKYALSLNIERI